MNYPKRLEDELARWISKTAGVVARKLEDTAAHAARTITGKLKLKPDGIPSVRHALLSPSYQAAQSRLDELRAALVGPTKSSLDGLLRDAREAFFVLSFGLWRPLLTDDFWDLNREPTQAGVNIFRGAIIRGLDLGSELDGAFDPARRSLYATVNLAGNSSTPAERVDDLIEIWRRQSEMNISRKCAQILVDSEVACWWAVETMLQRSPSNASHDEQ